MVASPRKRGTPRDARRQQILDAAIPVFTANGYSGAGIAEIAAAAGVSFGSVHYYFGSKRALFAAAVLEPLAAIEAGLAVPAAPAEGLPAALETMVREQIGFIIRQRTQVQLLIYVISQRERFSELAQAVADFGDRMRAGLMPLLEEGMRRGELAAGRPIVTASSYQAFVFGVSQVVILDPDAPIWLEYAERGLRLLGMQP